MQTLFVMDPLEKIHVDGDSTYMLMLEGQRRDHGIWFCTPSGLFLKNGEGWATAERVQVNAKAPHFEKKEVLTRSLGAFDVVWMRKDPPFDMDYILSTYLLDRASSQTLVVNHPTGLKLFNEKIWAMTFPDLHPPTLLSCDMEQIGDFVRAQPERAVLKPWDGNGGRGVLVTSAQDRNLGSMIELLTQNGRDYVIAQPYLKGADDGDKRILLFNGEPVGAVLRVPGKTDFRGNMHVGASVESCDLSPRDVEICQTLGPQLKKYGQIFVGIDVIDGYLTEINITSPTGIREINRLNSVRLEADLVDVVESCLSQHRETL
jgi:glutathione synthase